MNPIQNLLTHQRVIVIDGALGTELERKGCDLNDALWSSKVLIDNPDIVKDIHLSYLEAGADCITTSSYQSSIQGFMAHGFDAETAYALIRKSSEIAVEARDAFWSGLTEDERTNRQKPMVIASLGPYGAYLADGSEFRGDYPLDKQTMFDFYRPRIQALIEGGAEMLGCETLPSSEEALLVIELLKNEFPHVHAWFSFSAKDREHISNGETIESVIQAVAPHDAVIAIGINCTAPQYIDALIQRIATQTNKPIIVYPNSGETYDAEHKTWHDHSTHGEFATQAQTWFEHGARLIGGCCRTSPREIKDVAMRLKSN
ncbi:Homocysteine S-methyltransferase [Ephemeroptericola cinctiostellae]|uniref:S-methylmethionine:homocysteine methyltransferase n=1 Tax=Ephemeroptericola cinctiostellae TaxID=2268024 RepID=A0A345D8Z6_9BURK|nr:homocysteine S-methyltransferase [Ephemeroptericola cinctiostellae]AXF84834.1 Homocysteine S-methyltransferase [Ephemeroptericola cinctiostellae]